MLRLYRLLTLGLFYICLLGQTEVIARPRVHQVRQGENLSQIARRYGLSQEELRQWNGLTSDRIVVGQRLRLSPGEPHGEWHVVEPGETLTRIAFRYGLDLKTLRQLNHLTTDTIYPGQKLRLPPAKTAEPLPAVVLEHVVEPGETLTRIAFRYGLDLKTLRQLNHLTTDTIHPGQKLQIQRKKEQDKQTQSSLSDTLPRLSRPQQSAPIQVATADTIAQNQLAASDTSLPSAPIQTSPPDTTKDSHKTVALDAPDSLAGEEEIPLEYVVCQGDSLSGIAQRFEIDVGLLRQLNRLKSDNLYPGQRLRLYPTPLEEAIHIVQQGETLSQIAQRYGLTAKTLRELNGLEGSKILVGQKLRLKETPTTIHVVERGDALWEISRAYGMTVEELKKLNGLTSDYIYPGQELKLSNNIASRYVLYTVKKGEYLGQIARLHQMSVAELKKLNNLRGSVIHPGQQLKVRPLLGGNSLKPFDSNGRLIPFELSEIAALRTDNGPYYFHKPRALRQAKKEYFENHPASPLETYRQARRLWEAFERAIDKLERLSNTLEGWHIVIDPGHGGLDPGAIVPYRDDNGTTFYVVEDEYMYDIALRVYLLLRLHGAQVTMTVLSPNHLIRQVDPPSQTFVNQKNEVYNSFALNKSNNPRVWPRGGNLNHRVRIAREALAKAPQGRRLFLSFHGDIDARAPEAPLILYYESKDGRRRDLASRNFAKALLPALGAGARLRGQPLGVLRDNPADFKILLELRNMAYRDHLWALRFDQLRHRDAEKVVKGILDYVRGQALSLYP